MVQGEWQCVLLAAVLFQLFLLCSEVEKGLVLGSLLLAGPVISLL